MAAVVEHDVHPRRGAIVRVYDPGERERAALRLGADREHGAIPRIGIP
jgi:hypothetical protein